MKAPCSKALFVALLAAACGGENKEGDEGAAGVKTAAPPEEPPPVAVDTAPLALGVTRPADFGYEWGKGARAFTRASAAHAKQDWVRVRSACEEAIADDPGHLEAHRLLASALAQQGEYEPAIGHLKIALAGDWVRWGGGALADPDLEPLVSSSLGAGLKELLAAHHAEFVRVARNGLLVVARRAAFKEPTRPKKGSATRLASRAEVFAYAVDTRRYLRLTQTGFQVLGTLLSPSGEELTYVTASHVIPATADPSAAGGATPAILATTSIGMISLATPEAKPAAPIVFKNARAIAVEYLPGDEIVATTYVAQGPWDLGQPTAFTVDRATGKAKPTRPPAAIAEGPPGRRLLVRYEAVELETPGDGRGIAADWNPETGAAEEFVIDASKKRVQLPAGEAARQASLTWSPDRSRLAFTTAADPCAAQPEDRQSALYVVEAESGKLKHILRGSARMLPVFVGPTAVAVEAEGGGIALYDATVARQVGRIDNQPGIAFHGLGAAATPPCPPDAGEPGAEAGAPGAEGPAGAPGAAAPGGAASPAAPAAAKPGDANRPGSPGDAEARPDREPAGDAKPAE